MESVFESQDAYDAHIRLRQTRFDAFLLDLEQNMRKFVKVDQIALDSNAKIIRPQKPIERPSEIRYSHHAEPVYYGYHGFTDAIFYAWIWSSMAHSHGVHVSNFDLVDESGHDLMSVGADGIDAGDGNLLDPGEPFEAPSVGSDLGGNGDVAVSSSDGSSGGWFGSFSDSSSDGGSFDGSSSCGSNCGGCGGD